MKKLNITDLLEFLGQIENGYADFREFLEFHGNRAHPYVKFWRFFEKIGYQYLDKRKDRLAAFKAVYGKGAYNANWMRTLLKQLYDLLDKFMLFKKAGISALGQLFRAEIYSENGAIAEMFKALGAASTLSTSYPEESKHLIGYAVHRERFYYEEVPEEKQKQLEEWETALNHSYFINQLKVSIEKLTRLRNSGKKIDPSYKKRINQILALLPEESTAMLNLLSLSVRYFLKPGKSRYQAFKAGYFEKVDLLTSDRKFFFVSLINAVVVAPRSLRSEYIILYKWAMDKNLFIQEGLSSVQFDNMVFTAEGIGDHEMIDNLIATHSHLIQDKDKRERSVTIAKSFSLFGKGSYEEALALLVELDTSQAFIYAYKAYLLEFKCIYEKEKDKQVALLLIIERASSFRRSLKRHLGKEISIDVKTKVYNFLNILTRLADRKSPRNSKQALLEKYDSFGDRIVESKWIKEKLAELG